MTSSSTSADRLVRAVLDPGRSPAHHRAAVRNLRQDWRALAAALADVVAESRGPAAVPMEWRR